MIEQILQADRLLQVDQVDQARDAYQRVVTLDPGNAIARVGLAQCALADGDDRLAHQLAGEALEIDPENDMARRMEARLAEILSTRGESVERPGAVTTPGSRAMRPMVTEAAPAGTGDVASAGASVTPSESTASSAPSAAPASGPATRRSLFDRLMGR